MKIALVSPYSWTVPGGVNRHIASLAGQLQHRGHEVRVLAPADGLVEPGVIPLGGTVGVPFNGSVARLAFGPRVAARVRIALLRARPDIVHIHEPFAPSVSLLALMSARVPVVATFHVAGDSRLYRAAGIALGRLWRKIDARIAVSPAARDTVEGAFGPGARIIPNGVDVARYAGVLPVDPATRTVLYFGRLERRKGPQILVAALDELLSRVPDARVIIAGEGPLEQDLRDAVPERHARAVSFTGFFDLQDQISLLSAATVVCLPALGGESFGLTLIEAMAAGRPVVASDIPGYAGVARSGQDARMVPPGDAAALAESIAGLLDDADELRRLSESGRERARSFDWPLVADQVEEVYREVAARASRGSGRVDGPMG